MKFVGRLRGRFTSLIGFIFLLTRTSSMSFSRYESMATGSVDAITVS